MLDALTYAGNPESLEPAQGSENYRFVHGDVRDQCLVDGITEQEGIDTVVHFAAESHVNRSIVGPGAFVETNIVGTHNLLKAAKKAWLDRPTEISGHRFHHVLTDEVYGSLEANEPPFLESSVYAPNSPYAASKAAADHLVRAYHRTYGLVTTISNCSNNYGPYQFPEKLLPLMTVNSLEGKPLPIYGDGLNVRDWLYVEDHCRGVELVLDKGLPGETYNIGGNNEWANINVVKLLCELIIHEAFSKDTSLKRRFPKAPATHGKRTATLISYVKDRPGHDRRYAIDAAKITEQLGYSPQETFESGIRKTLEWYLHNESWWRNVMDGWYREWITKQYAI